MHKVAFDSVRKILASIPEYHIVTKTFDYPRQACSEQGDSRRSGPQPQCQSYFTIAAARATHPSIINAETRDQEARFYVTSVFCMFPIRNAFNAASCEPQFERSGQQNSIECCFPCSNFYYACRKRSCIIDKRCVRFS